MTARSWGHAIYRLSDEGRAEHKRCAKAERERWGRATRTGYECATGRRDHIEDAAFVVTYQYVTGRGGRVSYARKLVCEKHGEAFAAKHDLDLEQAPIVEDAYGQLSHATETAFADLHRDPRTPGNV